MASTPLEVGSVEISRDAVVVGLDGAAVGDVAAAVASDADVGLLGVTDEALEAQSREQ